ncbi:MAG: type VI secretion system protein TssA [Ramlibacter sp.]
MLERDRFAPEIEPLLLPIAANAPSGASLRYDPVFLQLRQAREEDDPTLPMGEWERPLKKADWRAMANQCAGLLSSRSKDLQLAAWLCEAWTRQHRMDGFLAGVRLLNGLVDQHWDSVHPQIEDGDVDARVASFVWMNENLSLLLRLHVPVALLPERRPPHINLAEWEQLISGVVPERGEDETPLDRDQVVEAIDTRGLLWLDDLGRCVQQAADDWDALSRKLDDKLALEAPSLGKVSDTLRRMQRACASLMNGRSPHPPAPPAPAAAQPEQDLPEEQTMTDDSTPAAGAGAAQAQASLPSGPITSREDAYRLLEAAAEFLQRTEPHSPTPYLVKRAVSWGQMSLADLMQEIVREEGDLTRYFSLLGIHSPRD